MLNSKVAELIIYASLLVMIVFHHSPLDYLTLPEIGRVLMQLIGESLDYVILL